MKRLIFCAAFAVLLSLSSVSAEEWEVYDWEISLEEARERAVAEDKEIMYYFAGSDWCGWCERLVGEVFSQELFRSFEERFVVPVLIDFPREREISEELQERNGGLSDEFEVEGYPTVVILSAEGEQVFRTGYRPGGAGAYVNHLLPYVR
ncbi:MAG: thioredoxin family protein [Alkalispirochaetaceae bacterium]